jgi:hypothetical protein
MILLWQSHRAVKKQSQAKYASRMLQGRPGMIFLELTFSDVE